MLVKRFTNGVDMKTEEAIGGADDPKSWPWLQAELLAKGAAIATSLRSGVAATDPVPNLEWNVGRLGAHIVSLAQFYEKAQNERLELPDFSQPSSVEEFSAATSADVGTTDPQELADMLVPELQKFIDRLGKDGDAPAKWYQHDLTVQQIGGVVLSELLVHHIDLVGATGEPKAVVKVTGDQARAAFRGLFVASGYLVNPKVARKCTGTIHIHLTGSDGGDHWTTTIANGGAVTTPGRPDDADFHTRAEPVALLLTSLGRSSQVVALLTGQIIGYGRKPLLALRSQNLFYTA